MDLFCCDHLINIKYFFNEFQAVLRNSLDPNPYSDFWPDPDRGTGICLLKIFCILGAQEEGSSRLRR